MSADTAHEFRQFRGLEGEYEKCLRCGTRDPAEPCGVELTKAEELGVLVGAVYGQALAERDQAIDHLRRVLAEAPAGSFAHANVVQGAAQTWLEEFDASQAVGSPKTPEQETTGP